MKAITSADRAAAAIRNLVCARQSASAAETVVVATTTIGKWLSSAAEPSRSWLIDRTLHPQGLLTALGQHLVQQRSRP